MKLNIPAKASEAVDGWRLLPVGLDCATDKLSPGTGRRTLPDLLCGGGLFALCVTCVTSCPTWHEWGLGWDGLLLLNYGGASPGLRGTCPEEGGWEQVAAAARSSICPAA